RRRSRGLGGGGPDPGRGRRAVVLDPDVRGGVPRRHPRARYHDHPRPPAGRPAAAGRRSRQPAVSGSTSLSSYTVGSWATAGSSRSTSTSEWAPHPWSALTTLPSSGAYRFPQTPNNWPSQPASGSQNPHEPHLADGGAAVEIGAFGPRSPSYHRRAVSMRPCRDITRARPRPSSQATSSTAGSSECRYPGTSRSSSGGVGSRSPTPRSPGLSRSSQGTHSGARSASGPGSSTVSLTVTRRLRG